MSVARFVPVTARVKLNLCAGNFKRGADCARMKTGFGWGACVPKAGTA
jgi:hypothetical protein